MKKASFAPRRGNERAQKILLRAFFFASLLALPAVVAPRVAAEKLSLFFGLAERPQTPLLLYMMAGGSAVYVGQAVLMWLMSCDVARYRPLINVVAWGYVVCGPLFAWIHSQAGTPQGWLLVDVVGCLAFGMALVWACHTKRFAA